MTDKKLRKLRRAALIELLIEQLEENERLTGEIDRLHKQLQDREIAIENAGSIAEAALVLNDVFLAAENAATQYVDNLARINNRCDEILSNAQQEAARIIREAQEQVQPQPLPLPQEPVAEPEAAPEPEPEPEPIPEEPEKEIVVEEAIPDPDLLHDLPPELLADLPPELQSKKQQPIQEALDAFQTSSKETMEHRFDEVFAQMRRRNK